MTREEKAACRATPSNESEREERIRRFSEENREAIDSYNRFIEEHGIWSEKYRSW